MGATLRNECFKGKDGGRTGERSDLHGIHYVIPWVKLDPTRSTTHSLTTPYCSAQTITIQTHYGLRGRWETLGMVHSRRVCRCHVSEDSSSNSKSLVFENVTDNSATRRNGSVIDDAQGILIFHSIDAGM